MNIQNRHGQKNTTSAVPDTATSVSNPDLELANDFIQYTNCSIFLTGKAGTGKTTFLHTLKKRTSKRMIVTAPTGVAAINAGGVTLHSFFQMPFGPFVQGSEAFERNHMRKFSREKIDIIKSLDLLVIDEISMVRSDLLDCVDGILRSYRRNNLPFGGVQLLMIGDLHQLSPVVKEAEWSILREHYDSAYFFGSNALRQTELIPIELKHIYRQSDIHFIELLNRVRDNMLDQNSLKQLNSRYIEGFSPNDDEGYITLSTHNSSTDAINRTKLEASPNKTHCFKAEIEGNFPEFNYPTSASLNLKVGAQVMFVRNDASHKKLYFNGKIGKVTRISQDAIYVKCPSDRWEIAVEKATWENIQYKLDIKTRQILENKIGEFVQYPLKLAWAITIHKSQGLTFEKAIIDTRAAFAHGQVYVALSRCKTFEGMRLSSPISSRAVKTDNAVLRFVKKISNSPPSKEKLEAARNGYYQRLLNECFDFQYLCQCMARFDRVLQENPLPVQISTGLDINELKSGAQEEIFNVSEKFNQQLLRLFVSTKTPETDAVIGERVTRASTYFQKKIEDYLEKPLNDIRIDTDNKMHKKRINQAMQQLKKETCVKLAAVRVCQSGFSPDNYLEAISKADIGFRPDKINLTQAVNSSVLNVAHPALFQALRDWRSKKASEEKVPAYRVLHQKTLVQVVEKLPGNLSELKKINGIGKRSVKKYGDELVALVTTCCQKHGIDRVLPPESEPALKSNVPKQEQPLKFDTKMASFDLFKAGLTVSQIAKERELVNSTVEGHLKFFVEEGKLTIDELLSAEKQRVIEKKLEEMKGNSLGEIKHALGNDYSYGEIKIVQAYLKSNS